MVIVIVIVMGRVALVRITVIVKTNMIIIMLILAMRILPIITM
jgi:hypothetical protein